MQLKDRVLAAADDIGTSTQILMEEPDPVKRMKAVQALQDKRFEDEALRMKGQPTLKATFGDLLRAKRSLSR